MELFGDTHFSVSSPLFLDAIEKQFGTLNPDDPESLRTFLVQAGQLEQAVADAEELPVEARAISSELVEEVAHRFVTLWRGDWQEADRDLFSWFREVRTRLRRLGHLLGTSTVNVRGKASAGVALFPEQYLVATERLLKQMGSRPGAVTVVSLRNGGLSFSAVVADVLRREGWSVRRVEVRAEGHPIPRVALLSITPTNRDESLLIVDEGKGLTDSAMISVRAAAIKAGYDASRIHCFPGHDGELIEVREDDLHSTVSDIARHFCSLDAPLFKESADAETYVPLSELLLRRARKWFPGSQLSIRPAAPALPARQLLPERLSWPLMSAPFDRSTFVVEDKTGPVLYWTFVGLGSLDRCAVGDEFRICNAAGAQFERWQRRAALGWTKVPYELHYGFVAAPWIAGTPVRAGDASRAMFERVARYIWDSAGPELLPAEQDAARARLHDVLFWNTREALGRPYASQTEQLADFRDQGYVARYGDGRMAPHHWVIDDSGRLWKNNAEGDEANHTIIGPQPIWWDVASVIVEWRLNVDQIHCFLEELEALSLLPRPEVVRFYRAAYLAWRLGQLTRPTAGTEEPADPEAKFYRDELRSLLERSRERREISQPVGLLQ